MYINMCWCFKDSKIENVYLLMKIKALLINFIHLIKIFNFDPFISTHVIFLDIIKKFNSRKK